MSTKEEKYDIGEILWKTLRSVNESDSNWEPANIVDALFFVGRAIHHLADSYLMVNGYIKDEDGYIVTHKKE